MRVILGTFDQKRMIELSRRHPGALVASTRVDGCARRGKTTYFSQESFKLVLAMLAGTTVLVTKYAIAEALWGDREDGGPEDKVIDVRLSRELRPQLASLGVFIETLWGQGFRMWGDVAPGDEKINPGRGGDRKLAEAPAPARRPAGGHIAVGF